MVRPQEAALPLASSTAGLPTPEVTGTTTAAIGRCAALTAANALTMPAPHWLPSLAQRHSIPLPLLSTAGQAGTPAGCGKAVELDFIREINCAGVRLALTPRIRAAIPETMGAEKLVPRLGLLWSVYVLATGVVRPVLVVVSMDLRHAEVFTQLPAGAATATSEPKLL